MESDIKLKNTYMRQEDIIRDFLAENLNFLSIDLLLIKKEYPLDANIGSKGSIDILAKDSLNNFVIIELKRSEIAARQTINEILKYQGLIKQQFKAQESEILIKIISTTWNELIIPFSEIYDRISIKGYKIILDETGIPVSKEIVQPIKLDLNLRKFSPAHSADLFYTFQKRNSFIKSIGEKMNAFGIDDYAIVKLKSTNRNKNIVYPYISYLAFQRQLKEKYYEIITNSKGELDGMEYELEEEEIHYLESCVILELETHLINDTAEYGSPEKFMGLIASEDWEIEEIEKYGIFKNDPRISDELIINEIKGYDGENNSRYLDFADSSQKKKLEKVKKSLKKSLTDNKGWQDFIHNSFLHVNNISKDFRVVVDIFYPNSIFDSIWRYYNTSEIGYLPHYNLFFVLNDANELIQFTGHISWNGKLVDSTKLYEKFDNEDPFMSFLSAQLGSDDKSLIKIMNLRYVNTLIIFREGQVYSNSNVKFNNGKLEQDKTKYESLEVFYLINNKAISLINDFYRQYLAQF